jgi:hypothetical protein
MKLPLLTIRINRRAIAGVVLENESVAVADGRHLSSRIDRAVPTALKYVNRLIELASPSALVIDAPTVESVGTTRRILDALDQLSRDRHLPLIRIRLPEILNAYGNPALETREELREIVSAFWPEVDRSRGTIRHLVIDAAAAALFADCRRSLEPAP